MNFKGSKVFDEFNEEEFRNNNQGGKNNQRVQISKYMEKDQSNMNNMNYSEEVNSRNTRQINVNNEESFNDNNNYNQMNNMNNNNISDKISMIKILISNYLKEKELDTYVKYYIFYYLQIL